MFSSLISGFHRLSRFSDSFIERLKITNSPLKMLILKTPMLTYLFFFPNIKTKLNFVKSLRPRPDVEKCLMLPEPCIYL